MIGERHERGGPAERDLGHAIAIGAGDGLDEPGLGVDEDRRFRAAALDHAGLDGHRRRANGALAAGNVVAAGVDEEEPEVRARRDRLGHHRNQEAAMAAGLEAESGAELVEMLLEPAALLADGGAGQLPEAAREEPHADPRGMEVRGRDHPVGAHRHLPPRRFSNACPTRVRPKPRRDSTPRPPVTVG